MARPTDYTEELGTLICSRIAEGESVRSIARDPEMPSTSAIFRWIQIHSKFKEQYDAATEERSHGMFEEMLEIADDKSSDVQRDRLRVDTRKWALSKMVPKKYGDKITQAIEIPAETVKALWGK